MKKEPRIEIVKTRAEKLVTPGGMTNVICWHARLVGANGRIVWTTETYQRRAGAMKACAVMFDTVGATSIIDVRDVDETGDKE